MITVAGMVAGVAPTRRVAADRSGRVVRWPSKDAAERLDYAIDWTERLAGAVIARSTFKLPAGIVAERSAHSSAVAAVRLAGGAAGRSYLITNRVETAAGQVLRQAVRIRIRARAQR
jgi:hypothetical protein